jgi:hypothetical protein
MPVMTCYVNTQSARAQNSLIIDLKDNKSTPDFVSQILLQMIEHQQVEISGRSGRRQSANKRQEVQIGKL